LRSAAAASARSPDHCQRQVDGAAGGGSGRAAPRHAQQAMAAALSVAKATSIAVRMAERAGGGACSWPLRSPAPQPHGSFPSCVQAAPACMDFWFQPPAVESLGTAKVIAESRVHPDLSTV